MKKGLIAVLMVIACMCLATQTVAAEKFFIEPVTHVVTVNYDLSVEEIARIGGLFYPGVPIDYSNFPVVGTGVKTLEMVVVYLNSDASTSKVRRYMRQYNLRPANLKELFFFEKTRPKEKLRIFRRIVELGTGWTLDGDYVQTGYLYIYEGKRRIDIYWDNPDPEKGWASDFRFLAVQE